MMKAECVKEPRAPFPYFGGKRNAAPIVWGLFGDVDHYVEPFCGSCAMLLARPQSHRRKVETVNDADGMLVNVWRAIRNAPEAVAKECAIPVMEIELHSRLAKVKSQITPDFVSWMEGDEKHFDAKLAADWIYCTCASIGTCMNDDGPWRVIDGHLVNTRKLPHLGDMGHGINRELPHLGNMGHGINRKLPHLGNMGRGINRKLPHLGDMGRGCENKESLIRQYLQALAYRLERVRICCGDWKRVIKSPTVLFAKQKMVGLFLDPPYSVSPDMYAVCKDVTAEVREWCKAAGDNPNVKIALCGFEADGHDELLNHGWQKIEGKAGGSGYNKNKADHKRERIYLSPAIQMRGEDE